MINKNFNILIIEDEFIALAYLQEILQEMGFQNFFTADNANDGKQITEEHNIDLVFMDININGNIDGISCAKLIDNNIPIIYTTAFADSSTINETKETNIFGYIIKPFSYEDIYSTLNVASKFLRIKIPNENINNKENQNVLMLKNYKYYKKTKTLKQNGIIIELTKKELEVFHQLCQKINQNISYNFLITHVWNDKNVSQSTIRDTVSRLKKKVPDLDIKNVSNFGYILRS